MAAKKTKKAATKKPRNESSLDDPKYGKKWHDEKIAEYTARLQRAKVEAPYLVKDLQKDIDWLKQSRRNSVRVAPPRSTGGGNPGLGRGVSGVMRGGGLTNRGK